ncbi:MAG: Pyrophosphohydrolase, NUDIX family [Lachnoclostridium sp.]|jgi:8-oxo-dGTP diphosphatase
MSRSEMAEFTVLCMIYDKDKILVQNRVDKKWPGICFPGGHVEPCESFVEAVKREVLEETGLTIHNPRICGVKQFQTENRERYVVLFFKTNEYTGNLTSSEEGEVFWISRDQLQNYELAEDFEYMVKVFENDNLNECYYYEKDNQ